MYNNKRTRPLSLSGLRGKTYGAVCVYGETVSTSPGAAPDFDTGRAFDSNRGSLLNFDSSLGPEFDSPPGFKLFSAFNFEISNGHCSDLYVTGANADNSLISVINHKASAHASSDTQEWTVVAALWGVLPLWKTTPSADITLSSRPITPGDCWPFRGSRGELVINLSQLMQVSAMSMEHVRPDSASSAPNRFHLYVIVWFSLYYYY
ncbi:hypothetical protein EVAR_13636_1 [Eumeta japonica]|uniref:SUN domain-containing protein n=1 Tax=Eumeta variegata TaxID=151549 RepID=A0A4C1UTB6_EUMVA|nr:hypothetical protein EVAR_13636_1 [Eumeta japonica]